MYVDVAELCKSSSLVAAVQSTDRPLPNTRVSQNSLISDASICKVLETHRALAVKRRSLKLAEAERASEGCPREPQGTSWGSSANPCSLNEIRYSGFKQVQQPQRSAFSNAKTPDKPSNLRQNSCSGALPTSAPIAKDPMLLEVHISCPLPGSSG